MSGTSRPLVLIVDDQEMNRQAVHEFLQLKHPDWVFEQLPGVKALEAWLNENDAEPMVVVTDLVMEHDQAGVTVLRRVKDRWPLCVVLIVTAYEDHLARYDAFAAGAFDCISKNAKGVHAVQEISVKANAAIDYRREVDRRVAAERSLTSAARHLDPSVFAAFGSNENFLRPARRPLTVVFWDIRGFSAIAETLRDQPLSVTEFLSEYFELAVEVIGRHTGVLDKFIGDGIMALFGVDAQQGDSGARDAVEASLELAARFGQEIQSPWLARWARLTPQQLQIGLGCGVNTGEAIVGNIATSSRDQFTALGPVVNFAARLEGRAAGGEVLISQTTKSHLTDGSFRIEEADVLRDIKNIPGNFQTYRVARL